MQNGIFHDILGNSKEKKRNKNKANNQSIDELKITVCLRMEDC